MFNNGSAEFIPNGGSGTDSDVQFENAIRNIRLIVARTSFPEHLKVNIASFVDYAQEQMTKIQETKQQVQQYEAMLATTTEMSSEQKKQEQTTVAALKANVLVAENDLMSRISILQLEAKDAFDKETNRN
ncbi:MAG: hypothetical protein ACRC5C_05565 [Bacilli bacterium]